MASSLFPAMGISALRTFHPLFLQSNRLFARVYDTYPNDKTTGDEKDLSYLCHVARFWIKAFAKRKRKAQAICSKNPCILNSSFCFLFKSSFSLYSWALSAEAKQTAYLLAYFLGFFLLWERCVCFFLSSSRSPTGSGGGEEDAVYKKTIW